MKFERHLVGQENIACPRCDAPIVVDVYAGPSEPVGSVADGTLALSITISADPQRHDCGPNGGGAGEYQNHGPWHTHAPYADGEPRWHEHVGGELAHSHVQPDQAHRFAV